MADEYKKNTPIAPFAYDYDYYLYTEKEQAEKDQFVSLMTQREASYRTPAEEIYNNKHLEDGILMRESFRDNIEPPTPQIKELDGYKSEEEGSGGGEGSSDDDDDCGDDDNNGDNNTNVGG